MPTNSLQPHAYISGLKGCGGCHRVGIKPDEEKKYNRYGMGCNSCHTRHMFSKAEAQKPQACQTCHMGFDHPQWEMWSSSKHGSIALSGGEAGRAPVCQTCHMPGGDHGVRTAWGFLAVRLPEDDAEWMGYRATILKALQVLDLVVLAQRLEQLSRLIARDDLAQERRVRGDDVAIDPVVQ